MYYIDFLTHAVAEEMQVLNLSSNPLHTIPVETGNFELLKQLHEWEVGIGRLNKLTSLAAGDCMLEQWPVQLERLTALRRLDLSLNELTTVAPSIEDNTALTDLDLSHNKMNLLPSEIYCLPLEVRQAPRAIGALSS